MLTALVSFAATAHAAELVPVISASIVARADTVRAFRFASRVLNETREIYVALPESFSHTGPERHYPVAVVLDGEAHVAQAVAVSAELADQGQIPEMVIVGIANRPGRTSEEAARFRVNDLTPPGLSVSGSGLDEGGDRLLDFIERELLPVVDRRFRGAGPRTLIGHSSGGVLATWAAATRPAFLGVVAIDTPVQGDWLPARLMERAARTGPALRYASYESRYGWGDAAWKRLVASAPATWRLHREHLADESHESIGMLATYLGLRQVFRDYSMLAADAIPASGVLPRYAKLSADMGAPVVPPRRLLRRATDDLIAEGNAPVARDAFRLLIVSYGAPTDSNVLDRRIRALERRPASKETVESLLATAFPTPDEAHAFLGDWVGDLWMSDDQPRRSNVTLRLRVESGHVVGETVNPEAPAEFRTQRWQYLKITPNGMTWGRLNGMRPRAVVLMEGTLVGDVLTGQSRFGGIEVADEGDPPPSLHFEFKRAKR